MQHSHMMTEEPKLPWYKQPLVWMLIAIPGSAVVAGMFTIYLAVTTDDGLVADDYYKQGMSINRQIEREAAAAAYQIAADVTVDPETSMIRVQFDRGLLPRSPEDIQLSLRHATQQRLDDHIPLQPVGEDVYVGRNDGEIRSGIWYIELSDDELRGVAWRISTRVRIDGMTSAVLRAQPPS